MNTIIKGCSNILIHVPDLVRYGSKPSREIEKDPSMLMKIEQSLRKFPEVVPYAPNQVFIGNMEPEKLKDAAKPWFKNLMTPASARGKFGEIMPEDEFYGLLKISDVRNHDLVWLEKNFTAKIKEKLRGHSLFKETDLEKIDEGKTIEEIKERLNAGEWFSLPLFYEGQLIGCFNRSKDPHAQEDAALGPHPLMESLVAKASGVLALKYLLNNTGVASEEIDFILSCSEEAVGDRYNRGGGGLAKVIGEACQCKNATGPDIKAFCVGPVYAVIIAASLVKAGVFKKVAVVGGGCLAKIGMKFEGHLKSQMPIIEDMLGGVAFLITTDDYESPVIRLDAIGKNDIKNAAGQEDVTRGVVLEPLRKLGKKFADIDRYAVQMENPEITVPSKTGNVPRKNYEMITSVAVLEKEIAETEQSEFIEKHGMPGFAPTQGHIPAGVAYLGHAVDAIKAGKIKNAMTIARGSLFLGRMSEIYDGASFIIEKNPGKPTFWKLISNIIRRG